jgi:hypothetical protein
VGGIAGAALREVTNDAFGIFVCDLVARKGRPMRIVSFPIGPADIEIVPEHALVLDLRTVEGLAAMVWWKYGRGKAHPSWQVFW